MVEHVTPNECIEGATVDGSSRDPLIARGKRSTRVGICNCFVADFDVDAHVTSELSAGTPKIGEASDLTTGARIVCQKSILLTFDRKPQLQLVNRTAKHKANAWHFAKQTQARIDRAHQELLNAIEKRQTELLPRTEVAARKLHD